MAAEIIEALLILSCKINKKMLNSNNEVRNLNQLGAPNEPFHERVSRFHQMSVNLLAKRWNELNWEDFTAEQQPASSSSIQITTTPNMQQRKRRSNEELIEELKAKDKLIEEKDKKLKIADTKILIAKTESFFYRERALKVREENKKMKEERLF
uniref:NAM-associated domain-containing protein n=1 Tax=Meloidogyne hapla TaxID=6305 RepID=A0A1I8C304_MELHA